MNTDKRVLGQCCGSRMMWFDRMNPAVLFGDNRDETLTVSDRSHGKADGKQIMHKRRKRERLYARGLR